MNAEDSYTTATEAERSVKLADDVAHSDPLSVRPALKDVLVGVAAMLVPYLLLIGAYLGIKKLDLGGVPSAALCVDETVCGPDGADARKPHG
ncbi:hypothetical protein [Corynebacterium sp.]|nr:hypothetical protein [Corynebacterium sp.]